MTRAELDEVIRGTLTDRELGLERTGEGSYLVSLPGTHRLATPCWLVVGDHALLVEAFVMRHADEGHAELYDFLLQRNSRVPGNPPLIVNYFVPRHALQPGKLCFLAQFRQRLALNGCQKNFYHEIIYFIL